MSNILVTGGAGFIGSHLVKRLVQEGHNVKVLDILLRGNKIDHDVQKNIELHKVDIRDGNKVMKLTKNCDYIFHLAAILGVDVVADHPVETMEVETVGMQNIVDAVLKNGVEKVVYASTSGVYGHSAIEQSVVENIQLDPRTSYAIAKRYNEIYLAALYEEKGMLSTSLRFFNVYGINQDARMVTPRFFEQALAGQNITVYGDGRQTRDFTYIDDTIEACIRTCMDVKGCEIFNVAQENELTIKDLATEIVSVTNSKSKISLIEAPRKRYDYEVERRVGNSDKLFNTIGYRPETKLSEGLPVIYNHMKNNGK
ncbi:MAG: NAD-dependent epimerase/dehydratase family protein [Flavobacteriales bacterium]|nr:NAD-dependent epimerase/dehydratase family protein [Flavobacteriales bacterium]